MAKIEQIRAARALLGWSQKDLADRAGLSQTGIARMENGEHQPQSQTLAKIASAFEKEGVVFTRHGVEHHKDSVVMMDSFLEVLEDAGGALRRGQELMLHCADERRNSPAVTEKFRQLQDAGIRLRFTCCEGNHAITTDPANYRWIDSGYFADSEVSAIYDGKYALHIVSGGERNVFLVIRNADFAGVMRRQFEYWWKRGRTWQEENIT